jgi:Mce-associated membrane protein
MAVDADAAYTVEDHPLDPEAVEGNVGTGDDLGNEPVPESVQARRFPLRLAAALGVVMCLATTGLAGSFGWRTYQSHHQERQQSMFVQVARQGAVNLTTIDYAHADADVQRILDSATGGFYDDFAQRAQPFIDVVKKAQSKSQGNVTEAGLESEHGDSAQVLVAVSVNTTVAGTPDPQPRAWRMRVTVQQAGDGAKVSNVEFVA